MAETRGQQLRANLKRLAAIHAAEMSALEESVSNLLAELEALSRPRPPAPQYEDQPTDSDHPTIDRGVMCVVYHADPRTTRLYDRRQKQVTV